MRNGCHIGHILAHVGIQQQTGRGKTGTIPEVAKFAPILCMVIITSFYLEIADADFNPLCFATLHDPLSFAKFTWPALRLLNDHYHHH